MKKVFVILDGLKVVEILETPMGDGFAQDYAKQRYGIFVYVSGPHYPTYISGPREEQTGAKSD